MAVIPLLLAFTACGMGQQITNVLDPAKDPINPVAVINAPSQATVRSYLTLDGTQSYGRRNGALTYKWTLTEKPKCSSAGFGSTAPSTAVTTSCVENATLTLPSDNTFGTTSGVMLFADKGGYYTVTLSVQETPTPAVSSAAAAAVTSKLVTKRINVVGYGSNHPPVAVARAASLATDVAALSASESYDIDGHPLSYSWKIMSPLSIPTEAELTNQYTMTSYLYNWLATPQSILVMLHVSDGLDYDEAVLAVTFP
jgi:hypothetical protein